MLTVIISLGKFYNKLGSSMTSSIIYIIVIFKLKIQLIWFIDIFNMNAMFQVFFWFCRLGSIINLILFLTFIVIILLQIQSTVFKCSICTEREESLSLVKRKIPKLSVPKNSGLFCITFPLTHTFSYELYA